MSAMAMLLPEKIVQAPPPPAPTTTTLHRLVEEKSDSEKIVVIDESDVSRPDMNHLVLGRKVEGLGLCTPVSLLFRPSDRKLMMWRINSQSTLT